MRRVSIPLVLAMLFLGAWNVQAQKVGRAEIRDAIHKLKSPNPEWMSLWPPFDTASKSKASS